MRLSPILLVLVLAGVVAAVLSAPRPAAAQNQVLPGPGLNNNVSGWDDSGIRFSAVATVDLLSFRYENQGLADTIWLLDSTGQTIQTLAVPSGQTNFIANVNWPLTGGQTYYLIADQASNGRWTSYTNFPTANSHISVAGVWRNTGGGTLFATWWFNFRDITTGSANVTPIADAGPPTGSYTGAEGSPIVMDGSGSSDPDGTIVLYEWDCTSDGSVDASSASAIGPTCVYPDDGTFVVTLTVTDDASAQATATATVTTTNVPPTITSTPSNTATEGSLYSYPAAGTDPGTADTLSWTLGASSPAGMTVAATGGEVLWTPGWTDALAGSVTAALDLADDDGGSTQQNWVITVDYLDADQDGMPDTWEVLNGLDPTDALDALLDPDGDGLINLDEWLGGTDPNSFDGPSAPVLVTPIAGEEVGVARPELHLANATDPQADPLTYEFEVFADASAQSLLAAAAGVPEGSSLLQQTFWTVTVDLPENADVFWRARAADPYTPGSWSPLESFFVNAVEEAPPTPVLQYPTGGETVAVNPPQLTWTSGGEDPDRDAVTWTVGVYDEAGLVEVTVVAGLTPGGGPQELWDIDVSLVEDSLYTWTAQAEDEHGLTSAWATGELFLYSLVDSAPTTPVWVAPLDGEAIDSVAPWLVVEESSDPEQSALTYHFEVGPTADFDGPDVVGGSAAGTGTGTVSFSVASLGAELEENAWAFARAQADDGGAASPWAAITFFVRGDNDPPPTPALLLPEDGWETSSTRPTFVIAHVEDPEGDEVVYEIIVAVDEELSEVEAGALALLPGAGDEGGPLQTSWTPESGLAGDFFWSARAVDSFGSASEWAAPFRLQVLPVLSDDDRVDCICGTSNDEPGRGLGLLALALLGATVRRRSSGSRPV